MKNKNEENIKSYKEDLLKEIKEKIELELRENWNYELDFLSSDELNKVINYIKKISIFNP